MLRAAWVAPMDGPPIADGGVVFADGRVIETGRGEQLARRHPGAVVIDRSDCTILPGLVNPHTHLELSEFACGSPPASFVEWVSRLAPRGQTSLDSIHESVARSVPIGVAQCLRFGVTCVGDISRHASVSRPLLTRGPLRVVSFGEVQAMAQRRTLLEGRIAAAIDSRFASEFVRVGLLDDPTLLAHVNYCDDDELQLLARGRASVVYCPRTHAYFGHPPHRWREMLEAGINVAVGTDSCASSPDLNLVEELRLLHRLAPRVAAEQLWELATIRAARAVRMHDEVGSLSPGKRADFAMFPLRGDHPLSSILESELAPSEVWIGGACVSRHS